LPTSASRLQDVEQNWHYLLGVFCELTSRDSQTDLLFILIHAWSSFQSGMHALF